MAAQDGGPLSALTVFRFNSCARTHTLSLPGFRRRFVWSSTSGCQNELRGSLRTGSDGVLRERRLEPESCNMRRDQVGQHQMREGGQMPRFPFLVFNHQMDDFAQAGIRFFILTL